MTAVATPDVERFRVAIADGLGLQFDETKSGLLAEVLTRRLDATGTGCRTYLDEVEGRRSASELAALAGELTTPETYFYRNIDQFHALAERVLPERMKQRAMSRQLRVLSAGCASGEEAFTVAMILRDVLEPAWQASILAVDANLSVLEKAGRGRYSPWSLRETPADAQERWFTREGREVVLSEGIRAAVTLRHHNLADGVPALGSGERYDVIFCRNVIMYFTPDKARDLVDSIARALAPGGFLFLGHAETLRGVTQNFHLCHTHETFYYQRKTDDEIRPSSPPVPTHRRAPEPIPPARLAHDDISWVEAIGAASSRVRDLVDDAAPAPRGSRTGESAAARARGQVTEALVLLGHEQFGAALTLLDTMEPDAAADPDVLLLQAVLLTHASRLADAELVCAHLLELDDLSAPAHYVLALCREAAGDLAGAAEHDRMATYLDPRLAMPRLHLGLLARRAKDLTAMREHLRQAAVLLEHEEASTLLLFGGGFSRDGLIALCHAEMREKAVQ